MGPVVYRTFDHRGQLLYVGCSESALRRIGWHMRQSPWFGEVASITLVRHSSLDAARRAEAQAIQSEAPAHNVIPGVATLVRPPVNEDERTRIKASRRWLTPTEAAKHIHADLSTLYRKVAAGLLPLPVDLDGLKRWDRLALDAAMEALQKPPLPRVPDAPPRRGRGRPRKNPAGIFGPEPSP